MLSCPLYRVERTIQKPHSAFQRSLTSSLSKFVGTPDLDRARRLGQDVGEHEPPHHRRERGEARGEEDPADHDPGDEQERPAIGLRGGDGGGLRRLGQGRLRLGVFLAGGGLGRDGGTGGGRPLPFGGPGRGGGRDLLGLLRPGLAQRLGQVLRIGHLLQRRQRPGRRRGLGRVRRRPAWPPPASRPRGRPRPRRLPTARPPASPSASAACRATGPGTAPREGLGTEVRFHDDRRLALDGDEAGGAFATGAAGAPPARAAASFSFSVSGLPRLAGVGAATAGEPRPRGPARPRPPARSRRRAAFATAPRGTAGPRGRQLLLQRQRPAQSWRASGRSPPARPGPRPIRTPRPASAPGTPPGPLPAPEPRPPASPVRPAVRPPGCLSRSVVQPSVSSASRKTEVPSAKGSITARSWIRNDGITPKAKAVPQIRDADHLSSQEATARCVDSPGADARPRFPELRIRPSRLPDRENTRAEADFGSHPG